MTSDWSLEELDSELADISPGSMAPSPTSSSLSDNSMSELSNSDNTSCTLYRRFDEAKNESNASYSHSL